MWSKIWPCQLHHYAYSTEKIFLQDFLQISKNSRNVSSLLTVESGSRTNSCMDIVTTTARIQRAKKYLLKNSNVQKVWFQERNSIIYMANSTKCIYYIYTYKLYIQSVLIISTQETWLNKSDSSASISCQTVSILPAEWRHVRSWEATCSKE